MPDTMPALETKKPNEWSRIEVRSEGLAGLRHYLDGRGIHCGEGIELQVREVRYDEDTGRSTTTYHPRGIVVRYEATQNRGELRATLHVDVAGDEFVSKLEPWMRFRWPVRR